MIGSTIGTYRVLRALGQGGMGTVYLAEHVLLGRPVALKVLLPRYSMDQEIVRRFFNEARTVTSISDPGIVQIFDFGFHTDASAYLVMEYLEGEPLDARLRRHGRLLPADAVRLVRQCAGSLAAVHAKGIIHRDLKPENLYAVGDPAVTGGERLKILDFGIAKLIGDDVATSRTRTGVLIGTPIYMSPEQCRGMGVLDFRSDVYSLGCVLFALLAGRPPFVCQSSGELIVSHLREPAPSLMDLVPGVPRKLDDIVQCCLAKEPAARYPSMQALAHALDLVIATALVPPPPGPPAPMPAPVVLAAADRSGAIRRAAGGSVTTLRGANGQAVAAPAPGTRRRRGWMVAAGAAAVAALVLGAALRGGGERYSAAAAATGTAPTVVDAPPAPPPVPAAPVAAPVAVDPAPAPPAPAPAVAPPAREIRKIRRAHRPRPQEDEHATPATPDHSTGDPATPARAPRGAAPEDLVPVDSALLEPGD